MKKEITTIDNKPVILYSRKLDLQSLQQEETYRRTIINAALQEIPYPYKNPTDFVNYFVVPIAYYKIVVVAFDKEGLKSAAWERAVFISGASGVRIIGYPSLIMSSKEDDIGLNCEFVTEGNEFIVRATGLDKTSVCWIMNLEQVI